ncbi:STAS domain-containing protein [Nonomuraea diastatica]|uniref:STAS domain-containing protein n=1 Tax=Nonomuraea diastatica TaxID=1848329 RepID=UPI00140842D0|nr:STAS domain-containing protein [Nonomuraea diastatica]
MALQGELDLCTAPLLLTAVSDALAGEPRMVRVDAEGLTFCDTHGMEALLEAQRRITDAGGSMELAHLNGRARRVLDLLELDSVLTMA